MIKLSGLIQVPLNEVAMFVYRGGTNPGSTRFVRVQSRAANGKAAKCVDLELKEARNFSYALADDVRVFEQKDFLSINFVALRAYVSVNLAKLTAEQLTEVFKIVAPNDYLGIRFNGKTGCAEYIKPKSLVNVNGVTMTVSEAKNFIAKLS
jgi:hypothetical protein